MFGFYIQVIFYFNPSSVFYFERVNPDRFVQSAASSQVSPLFLLSSVSLFSPNHKLHEVPPPPTLTYSLSVLSLAAFPFQLPPTHCHSQWKERRQILFPPTQ